MEQFIYSILLQQQSAESQISDSDIFSGLHSTIKQLLEEKDNEVKKNTSEFAQKNGANLLGGLSHFLSTPLKSDKEEIDRLIIESFENLLKQTGIYQTLNDIHFASYRILEPQQVPLHRQLVGVVKRILKNGKTWLSDSGVSTAKNSGDAFCSMIMVEQFSALPSVKNIFEQALQQKTEHNLSIFGQSISSVIFRSGNRDHTEKNIVQMNFVADENEVARLQSNVAVLEHQFGIKYYQLTKRTFEMGHKLPYRFQFAVDIEKHALGSIVVALVADDEALEDALTTEGSLIVLEKIS
ncbi:MAG: hypothetical protein PHP62_05870 [Candidatus Moranbacteria bacterium]|nr:hypothetical protein [Candidatus Moranbacteria bacterium]